MQGAEFTVFHAQREGTKLRVLSKVVRHQRCRRYSTPCSQYIAGRHVVCPSTDKAAFIRLVPLCGISGAYDGSAVAAANARVAAEKKVIMQIYGTRHTATPACKKCSKQIPLCRQIRKCSHPTTTTNPDMTRFLMNLDVSLELVKFTLRARESWK